MPFFVYMVECANGQFYTGWSTDPTRRLKQHNRGKGARFTRMNGPCQLVYVEEMPDLSATLKREIRIKQLTHPQKLKLIGDAALNCLRRFSAELPAAGSSPNEDGLLNPAGTDHQQNDPEGNQSQHA